MKYVIKCFLFLLCASIFLSCSGNADRQNTPTQQGTGIAVETTGGDPETTQATAEEIALISFVEGPPATAPYLANVMPNSWQNLTRLSPEEEELFLQSNAQLLNIIVSSAESSDFAIYLISLRQNIATTTRIYREQVGTDVFFRLLTFPEKEPDFNDHDNLFFWQSLAYNRNGSLVLLVMGAYGERRAHNGGGGWGGSASFTSITITAGRNRAKGVLAATVRVFREQGSFVSIRNSKLYGEVSALYTLMEDVALITDTMRLGFVSGAVGIYLHDHRIIPQIRIEAPNALVIPESPLRHGIQSAFDGNPASTFVANDDNRFVRITSVFSSPSTGRLPAGRIAIINACAEGVASYRTNSQVRAIRVSFRGVERKVELADDTLAWQVIENAHAPFTANEIYPDNGYNTFFITGINAYSLNYGWLFGDINE